MTHRTPVPAATPPARRHREAPPASPQRPRRVVVAGLGAAAVVLLVATTPARAIEDRAGMFAVLDADADGRLSPIEVRMTPLAARFTLLDLNADGALDRREMGLERHSGAPRPKATP